MQVTVLPAHRVLDDQVKAREVEIPGNDEAAPDRRLGSRQGHLELVDVGHGPKLWSGADIARYLTLHVRECPTTAHCPCGGALCASSLSIEAGDESRRGPPCRAVGSRS